MKVEKKSKSRAKNMKTKTAWWKARNMFVHAEANTGRGGGRETKREEYSWHTQFMFIFTQLEEQNITFLKSLSHSLACSFFLSFVFFFLFLRKNIFFRFKLK